MEMKKYAVIGDPIGHSLSPTMHNAAFKALGIDAEYEALLIKDVAMDYPKLKKTYSGINVTIPHKVTVAKLLDDQDYSTELTGAVNCISFGKKAKGYNTDLVGAIESLKTEVWDLKDKDILVLGAGGAARAIVYGCAMEGAKVSVYNRTDTRARELANDVKGKLNTKVLVQEKCNLGGFDVLVNATSVGMFPKADESPIDMQIPSDMVVMDIVYNPLETKLLKQAKEAGAKTIGGLEMFVRQGAESLRIWGYVPPVDVMRKAVMKKLEKTQKVDE